VSGVDWPEIPFKPRFAVPPADLARAERAAGAALRAEREAEAVRELDALQRDDAAMDRVRDAIGWIW